MDDVIQKRILPSARGFFRVEGSSYKARDFIDGEGRQLFQKEMTDELTRVLAGKHIVIHNAIIRHVEVPQDILQPIQQASVAKGTLWTDLKGLVPAVPVAPSP